MKPDLERRVREGVRRTAVLVGGLACVWWTIFIVVGLGQGIDLKKDLFSGSNLQYLSLIIISCPLAYFIPYGLIRLSASAVLWITAGFSKEPD